MYKSKKRSFPIKYLRRGLLSDYKEFVKTIKDNKIRRTIKKPKISVHQKTGMGRKKAK